MGREVPVWGLVVAQGAISAASLVVEIVAGRMLAPHVGMSLYTWTSVIAVVLAGFSAGHWWGGRLAELSPAASLRWTGGALIAAGATTAGAVLLLPLVAGPVLAALVNPVAAMTALTALVFFAPSFFAGVPAPVLTRIAVLRADRTGPALGAMFASGAVGAIAGTLLAGFVFIAWLGSARTLVLVTVVYLVTGALFLWSGRAARRWLAALAIGAVLLLAGAALAAPAQCHRESRYFCLRTEDLSADPARPVRLMVIDHLAHGIAARDLPGVQFTEHAAMLETLTVARAPGPEFTSFHIGGGTFAVPRALAARGIGGITVAEIDPEVTALAVADFWFDPDSATVLHEDARRALLTRPETRYDVIVGDAFTDVVVPVHLVTREFFALVASRLTPDGSFLMNVVDHEDRLGALASIVATLGEVFPSVEVWTQAAQPLPGQRMVFVVAAGQGPTPVDSFSVPAPDLTRFGALSDGMVAALVAERGLVLTDDYAPIDRLMGRQD